jgi:predicted nucleic-acid-binding Zn-ribbon protein
MKATIKLYPWELESMSEYSCSLPTGTTMWKMWKNNWNAYAVGIKCSNCDFTGRANTLRMPSNPQCPKCKTEGLRKIQLQEHWFVGQYIPCDIPGQIGIRWHEVILKEGPELRNYQAPDWDNYQRWKKDRAAERQQATEHKPSAQTMYK